ncbi:hypothetical protein ACKVEX_12635 [Rhodocyclaceae bacterium SMB388]
MALAGIRTQIDSGAAHAALCADFDAKNEHLLEDSPTFLFDEGRQKLYGNVGYRVIEASIEELSMRKLRTRTARPTGRAIATTTPPPR